MNIIHTSDWHLGNRLLGHNRQEEFRQFLDWMLEQMKACKADVLLISGDIFDSANPSDAARKLYSDFLSRADETGCKQVIVTAGNHDSALQLEVTAPLLERYHCRLVSRLTHDTAADCLIPVTDREGKEQALICAVPYLSVRDVALPAEADDEEGRRTAYTRGIAQLFAEVGEAAAAWKAAHPGCPVIGMGHLAVSGIEKTDSTHDIIGTLSTVSADIFPAAFDYTALGHIHRPSAADSAHRYCGSPLAMGMDEGAYEHHILLLETQGTDCRVRPIPVPAFTQMAQCRCDSEAALHRCVAELLEQHALHRRPIWLELLYSGGDISMDAVHSYLAEKLPEEAGHLCSAMRDIRALPAAAAGSEAAPAAESLQHYTPQSLFERRLREYAAEHPELDADKQAAVRELFLSLLTD